MINSKSLPTNPK